MNQSDLTTRAQRSGSSPAKPSALLPGAILAGRYRVVAPLGHGGMGDVYRADDLKLGQAVALKFLPPAFRNDEARRQRLRDEVKIARLAAHPNVCRVWDLVEADGHEFLAMEYVDGEDLASVLRRIGRLPEERAVRMARELCAGLSAIHEQGILHRDLKPANVMVDGRGRARIADFGLAALAESVSGAEASAGTPAYMSPEQHEGREVTVRSDVYALGLVLYEVFTGKTAFPSRATEERGSHPTPSSPSSLVRGLDPAIDRVIERCLEPDPALRPPSVVAVAASLPGGDPLAAAVAAGETPSPELVAAVGGAGRLRPTVALACLGAIVIGVGLVAWLGDRVSPFFLDLEKPPQVLVYEAQQILSAFGPTVPPADEAHGFVLEDGEEERRLFFWYRQSPRPLSQRQMPGGLSFENPARSVSGMAGVRLDAAGQLVEYVRVPGAEDLSSGGEADWVSLQRRAGLDPEALNVRTPSVVPPVFADHRHAWSTERDGQPVHVDAASLNGRPVWFRVARDHEASDPAGPGADPGVYVTLSFLAIAVVLARRNLRFGRGDYTSAGRLAAFGLIWSVVGSGPLKDPRVLEPGLFPGWVMLALAIPLALWVTYLALEPMVRRRWPDTLVSWTRLLRGRAFDARVGRDILIGILGGIGMALLGDAVAFSEGIRWPASTRQLAGGWYALADRVVDCGQGLLQGLIWLMVLALLRQLLRRTWAALVVVLLIRLMLGVVGGTSGLGLLANVLSTALVGGLLIRPGLLAAVVVVTVDGFLADTLMTTHFGAWYAPSAISGILATLLFAAWGFYASLGGQPLFADPRRDAP